MPVFHRQNNFVDFPDSDIGADPVIGSFPSKKVDQIEITSD
jgi:hypothetical protein